MNNYRFELRTEYSPKEFLKNFHSYVYFIIYDTELNSPCFRISVTLSDRRWIGHVTSSLEIFAKDWVVNGTDFGKNLKGFQYMHYEVNGGGNLWTKDVGYDKGYNVMNNEYIMKFEKIVKNMIELLNWNLEE